MKENSKVQAIMSVEKGEEIAGMWATPQIPRIGVYKLLAKKKTDGTCEWVHFQHREDGTKKVLFRGEVESKARLMDVLAAANKTLTRIFGVSMKVAEFDTYTIDGRKFDDTVH